MKNIYGFPALPKAGLANMLIPWAECFIWCRDNGIKQIAPFWGKIRLGPYLRGERDKRQYQKLFKTGGNISGFKRLLLLLTSKRISFEDFRPLKGTKDVKQTTVARHKSLYHLLRECSSSVSLEELHKRDAYATLRTDQGLTPSDTTLVCFSDMNHLERLIGRDKEIIDELYRITRLEYLPTGLPSKFIGIHIRMGDFPYKSAANEHGYFRQPLEWYIEALRQLRVSLGINLTAVIFSDGTDEELAPILELDNTVHSPAVKAVTDLLAIAKSTVIITSRSSFSLMGAFLGQVPSVWYQGKEEICKSGYMPKAQSVKLEVEWMPGQAFGTEFIDELKKRCSQGD